MMKNRANAFTLVELLVVIAIIGILVAMLLPAVQAAREAARRMQCGNNLKQIGLAALNYESTYLRYPAGATAGLKGKWAWGFGWGITLLPYTEQNTIYDNLDTDGSTCPSGHSGLLYGNYNAHNRRVLREVPFPFLFCPSSPLPQFVMADWPEMGPIGVASPCYVAILGAVDDSSAVYLDGSTRTNGIMSQGGIMTRLNGAQTSDITDGTSNTIIVGEQSDYLYSNMGQQVDARSDNLHSFAIGTVNETHEGRVFNTTTIRYPINFRNYHSNGIGGYGCNRPIQSAHSGGAQVVKGDGSVVFLNEKLDQQTLYNLCNRSDGNMIEELE